MHEIDPGIVQQRIGEFRLKWFSDQRRDLYLWVSDGGKLMRFQFCWGKGTPREQVVRWSLGGSLEHALVDDGERVMRKLSPVLVRNGLWDPGEPLEELRAERESLDPGLYGQLEAVIEEACQGL